MFVFFVTYHTTTAFSALALLVGLHVLCTESLELRFLRYDLIYVHKILFSLVDLNFVNFFAPRSYSTTRGHNYYCFRVIRA